MATRQIGLKEPLLDESLLPVTRKAVSFRPTDHRQSLQPLRLVSGLVLDAGNILYDDTAWRRWLVRLLARLGLRTEYELFFRILDRDYLDAVYRGLRSFGDAMDSFLISAGLSAGQVEEVHHALDSYRLHCDENDRPLTGVRETIARLHASGVKLVVLCNSEHSGETIRQRLTELLGESPWAAVISSHDLGFAMPDAACYREALNAVQLPLADIAFVGHDARELRGAAAMGLATFAFNSDRDARADVYLQRFEDLIELTRISPRCSAAA